MPPPARVTAELARAAVQPKPWGREVIFAAGEHGYVGKLLSIGAGQALSLQLHEHKDETVSVVSGVMMLEHGPSADLLEQQTMSVGDAVHLPAHWLHRMTAVTDCVLVEASTAPAGWRDDVIRLEDRYGRTGSTAP